MAFEKDPNEIGALWVKTSASGKDYMTGNIDGIGPVVVFRAKPSEKGPAWRVLKSKPKDDAAPREQRYKNEPKPATNWPKSPSVVADDEDLGF